MNKDKANNPKAETRARKDLLFHFCRMQLPRIALSFAAFESHLERTLAIFAAKSAEPVSWTAYLDNLYSLDWFMAVSCLAGDKHAWEHLFAARASRSDCLLVDALRARAVRLYPRDEERQESALAEFWSHLLVSDAAESLPVLARYDGQRPLVPWLIRVFQNWHVSQLRRRSHAQPLPEDDLAMPLPESEGDSRWHETFRQAAREWLGGLSDGELLILGLRMRYRQSQREAAQLIGVHEGTISRQTTQLRDRCLEQIGRRLVELGWTGDDLQGFVLSEMGAVLMDEPRLSADRLGAMLAARGKKVPLEPKEP